MPYIMRAMLSPHSADLRLLDPSLLLECVVPASQATIAKLLETEGLHLLVIFACVDESRYEYLDVGPGRRVRGLDEALSVHPEGHRAHFIVPSKSCPDSVLSSGFASAYSIPYALAKLAPMAPLPAAKPVAKIALPAASPSAAAPAPVTPAPVAPPAASVKRETVTEVGSPSSLQALSPVSFEPLADENPADTLRRALHGVLSSITDREASLSVREVSTSERQEMFSAREQRIEADAKALAARESAAAEVERDLARREKLVAEREGALAEAEEDFKTRKNSVAFREKSLAAREQEMEARLFDVNAREGALVAIERNLAARDVALAAGEQELLRRQDAFAAERARIDGEIRALTEELKSRESALTAREKTLAAREATFKAETVALLQTLETITAASRATSAGK